MKNLYLLCMLSFAAATMFGQNTTTTTSEVSTTAGQEAGIYGGVNFMNAKIQGEIVSATPTITSANGVGYQAGAYFRMGEMVYYQGGLEYAMSKSTIQESTLDSSNGLSIITEDDVTIGMLNIPICLGINLNTSVEKIVNVRLYVGPEVSFLTTVSDNVFGFSADDFSRVKLNGTLGAGLDIVHFTVDGGYEFGFSQLFDNEFDGTKANYAFINIGYKF